MLAVSSGVLSSPGPSSPATLLAAMGSGGLGGAAVVMIGVQLVDRSRYRSLPYGRVAREAPGFGTAVLGAVVMGLELLLLVALAGHSGAGLTNPMPSCPPNLPCPALGGAWTPLYATPAGALLLGAFAVGPLIESIAAVRALRPPIEPGPA